MLEKVASRTLSVVAPPVYELYARFQIKNAAQIAIMFAVTSSGLTLPDAACNWLRDPENEKEWRRWIPVGTCPVGTHALPKSSESSVLSCATCPPGSASAGIRATACTTCAIGLFQPEPAQFGCISCDNLGDFYQDRPGQTACVACPANAQRFVGVLSAANRSACQCKEGYYSRSQTPGEACDECPKGFRCAGRLDAPLSVIRNTLHLVVLVPTDAWPAGRASVGALYLALEAVNAQRAASNAKGIEYSWVEVQCDPSASIAAISLALEQGPLDALIGPWCSDDCESSAYLMGGRNILQVSYSCNSVVLSNNAKFPTFVRTSWTYRAALPAVVSFSKWAGWGVLTTLSSSDGVNAVVVQELVKACRGAAIRVAYQFQVEIGTLGLVVATPVRINSPHGAKPLLYIASAGSNCAGMRHRFEWSWSFQPA